MLLKDNLYTVTGMDRERSTVEVALCPDCVIYKAHFPERPVTPGVCIIQMAVELLGLLHGREYTLMEVSAAKFLRIISPLDMLSVTCVFKAAVSSEQDGTVKAGVSVLDPTSGQACAKLTLLCRAS